MSDDKNVVTTVTVSPPAFLMGVKGRWQKMVMHGDFHKWENCPTPFNLVEGPKE